ncbi:MAG: amidohydrolase family protein [Ilumatobacteraceae bacterium]
MSAGTTVIRGGRLIDPSQGVDEHRDLVVRDGVTSDAAANDGAEEFDASGLIVVPGLVDIHCHFFYGVTSMAVDPRTAFYATGTTVAVDAGTSGAANFINLRSFIMEPSDLHLYAFLNIYVLGMGAGPGDSFRHVKDVDVLDMAKVDSAAKLAKKHNDRIVGLKLLAPHDGRPFLHHTAELLARTREAAELSGTRVMCHIDGGSPLTTILEPLQAGDIVTHAFHSKDPNILDDGRLRPEVVAARDRGVVFDFAPADHHHFSWRVLEAAAAEGFWPDTISADIANPVRGEDPFAGMTDCMSMLLHIGMPMNEVVSAASTRAAQAIGRGDMHGSLAPGRAADVTVLELIDSPKTYRSMNGEERMVTQRLVPVATMIGGRWLWRRDRDEASA